MSKPVMIEVSARHVHISEGDLVKLFGDGAKLTNVKELSQPGQYACAERVTIVGPKNQLKNVVILGPTRPSTQVEISLTDARAIGVDAPVRESGDVAGSAGCKLIGPCGEIDIPEGVIAAKRHIHMTPEDAAMLNVEDKEIVEVKSDCCGRSVIFGDVVVRVSPSFKLAMHIDTDEANCGCLSQGCEGYIVK